jgi:hypothetical protein
VRVLKGAEELEAAGRLDELHGYLLNTSVLGHSPGRVCH